MLSGGQVHERATEVPDTPQSETPLECYPGRPPVQRKVWESLPPHRDTRNRRPKRSAPRPTRSSSSTSPEAGPASRAAGVRNEIPQLRALVPVDSNQVEVRLENPVVRSKSETVLTISGAMPTIEESPDVAVATSE